MELGQQIKRAHSLTINQKSLFASFGILFILFLGIILDGRQNITTKKEIIAASLKDTVSHTIKAQIPTLQVKNIPILQIDADKLGKHTFSYASPIPGNNFESELKLAKLWDKNAIFLEFSKNASITQTSDTIVSEIFGTQDNPSYLVYQHKQNMTTSDLSTPQIIQKTDSIHINEAVNENPDIQMNGTSVFHSQNFDELTVEDALSVPEFFHFTNTGSLEYPFRTNKYYPLINQDMAQSTAINEGKESLKDNLSVQNISFHADKYSMHIYNLKKSGLFYELIFLDSSSKSQVLSKITARLLIDKNKKIDFFKKY